MDLPSEEDRYGSILPGTEAFGEATFRLSPMEWAVKNYRLCSTQIGRHRHALCDFHSAGRLKPLASESSQQPHNSHQIPLRKVPSMATIRRASVRRRGF